MYKKLLNRALLCSKDQLYPCLVFSNSVPTLQHQSWNSRGAAGQKHRVLIKVEQRNDRNPVQHFPVLCITECYFTATGSKVTSCLHHSTRNLYFFKNCAHLQFWLASPGISALLGVFINEFPNSRIALYGTPQRYSAYSVVCCAWHQKSLEASTQERSWKITGWGYQHQRYHTVWSWDGMNHMWKVELNGPGYKEAEQREAHFALCRDRLEPQKRKRRKQALPVGPLTAPCETRRLTLAW